jgi:hypothetical protein
MFCVAVARVTAETPETDGGIVYTYRPSLLGAPWQFELAAEGIRWIAGRRSGEVRYGAMRRVRLSYRPANMQSYRFITEIWAEGAPKLRIVSTSWKSMFEQERLDKAYVAFVAALHRRLADANVAAVYERGSHPLMYWPGLAVFVIICLGFAVLVVRGLQQNAWAGAAFIAAFLLFFVWQGGTFFRRNRPGLYRPDAPPADLLPKA